MKKVLMLLCTVAMLFSLVACSNASDSDKKADDGAKTEEKVDMSKYPAEFNKWTAQNFVDYFNESVEFPKDCESWVQDHATYWPNMPIYEASGVWNVDGAADVLFMVYVLNPESPDTTPEKVDELKKAIKDNKNHEYMTDDLMLGIIDHMAGNIMISYSETTNEEVIQQIEEAYNNLIETFDVTQDF